MLVVKAHRVPRANRVRLVPRAARAIRGRPVLPEWRDQKESKVRPAPKGHKASKDLPVRKAAKEIRDRLARPEQVCTS